jgi:hypothetical protein
VLDYENVETIVAKRPCLQDSDSEATNDTDHAADDTNHVADDTDHISHTEAKFHILNLQRYFTQC